MTWVSNTMARVTAKLVSAGGDAVQNVFYIRNNPGDRTNAIAAATIGEWLEDVYGNIASTLSEEVNFASFNVLLDYTDEALGEFAWPTLTTGGATGDQLPPSNCVLSLFRTGFSRRTGRKYWGPFSESSQDNGLWAAGAVSACQAAALAASTTFLPSSGGSVNGVVFNFHLGAGLDIAQVATLAPVRTQRRRARGIGI